jgi:hypothetical protein
MTISSEIYIVKENPGLLPYSLPGNLGISLDKPRKGLITITKEAAVRIWECN